MFLIKFLIIICAFSNLVTLGTAASLDRDKFPIVVQPLTHYLPLNWSNTVKVLPAQVKLLDQKINCPESLENCEHDETYVKVQVLMPNCGFEISSIEGNEVINNQAQTTDVYITTLIASHTHHTGSTFEGQFTTACADDSIELTLPKARGTVILHSMMPMDNAD